MLWKVPCSAERKKKNFQVTTHSAKARIIFIVGNFNLPPSNKNWDAHYSTAGE